MAAITQPTSNLGSNRSILSAQFREIHKNTWLKRLSQEGKKITVGPKKSERSWVVFCVHDDTEAILEGYAEPRQAASHNPEWAISMQNTLHISHALIPNSNEFEFVVTLSNEVIRFHAMSWEIMQEWVETLRSKLREMKILSPRENLYTKLPEIRPPLLPTRDPTSPLPLPPPVPAAIVPGVEIVVPPHSNHQQQQPNNNTASLQPSESVSRTAANAVPVTTASSDTAPATAPANNTPAMSNTSTQNLLNMLSDPISSYSEQLQVAASSSNNLRLNTEQLSTSLNDLRLHQCATSEDEDCLSPLLRPGTSANIVDSKKRNSADQPKNVDKKLIQCDRLIPRPQTSRSQSAGAADKSKNAKQTINKPLASNITALEITTLPSTPKTAEEITTNNDEENSKSNITIIQVSTSDINSSETTEETAIPILPSKSSTTIAAEIFTFPESQDSNVPITNKTIKNVSNTPATKHSDYKSHVQLIPSNSNVNSSTIKIIGDAPTTSNFVTASNQYSTPLKKKTQQQTENNQITTVHVGGGASVYGTCFTLPPSEQESLTSTPKLPKKIILSANTSGITNIKVDSHSSRSPAKSQDTSVRCNVGNVHYEKVFLSSSIPVTSQLDTTMASVVATATVAASSHTSSQSSKDSNVTPTKRNAHKVETSSSSTPNTDTQQIEEISNATASPATTSQQAASNRISKAVQTTASNSTTTEDISNKPVSMLRSPLVQRRAAALRPPNILTRGLTEAVIMRPSRRDLFASSTPKIRNNPMLTGSNRQANKTAVNNNENGSTSISSSEVLDQRRRSSSTSDAATTRAPQPARSTRGSNNNELMSCARPSAALRFQQPPQPFRNVENGLLSSAGLIGAAGMSPPPLAAAASKRLTLREQQVMQLRREIMHPGGVRLQLRRKDCIGSIAWVEAFGAVWVAGWKQKEHPVLYNALHIGDQLLSIAGVSIGSAAEANKIIRNTNTLFVELLIRRMPFGCGIAIRRDREGQCLGLIRDGNTATIVDVVPNSLAARHGLPPKTQACDGSSLTFWVLTEINGRPLNLFFKDNEIRDRLNSVGRDISILVQPSDLITKLKKQLKSLRGYKDYLVQ